MNETAMQGAKCRMQSARCPNLGNLQSAIALLTLFLPGLLSAAGRMAIMSHDSLVAAELDSAAAVGRMTPHVTFGGVAAAVFFAAVVITVISWLLSVPKQVPLVAAHARRIVSAVHRIVVPVHPHGNWARAIELACRFGEDQKAEILLTTVIEVPFTLSLNAPMVKAEQEARALLDRALPIVELHDLPVRTQIERARQAGEGIARLAKDEEADLIVMAAPAGHPRLAGTFGRNIEILLHRAPCEVIIDAVPQTNVEETEAPVGSMTNP
jgi:nucleotide-binding universal stress UspA family protein